MKRLVYIVGYFLYITNLYKYIIFLRRYNLKILVYHDVSDGENPFIDGSNITISAHAFKNQMLFLKNNYRVVDLETVVNNLGKKNVKRNVAITFDDAYESFLTNAYPILNELGFHATIFLIGKCTCEQTISWRNELIYFINQYPDLAKTLAPDMLKEAVASPGNITFTSKADLLKKMMQITKHSKPHAIENIMRHVRSHMDAPKAKIYLSLQDCKELSSNDVDFGNHSYSHWNFDYLSENEIDSETREWQSDQLKEINFKHYLFAFPFGEPLKNKNIIEEIAKINNIRFMFYSNGLDNNCTTSSYEVGRHHLTSEREYQIFTEMELFPFLRRLRDMVLKGSKLKRFFSKQI